MCGGCELVGLVVGRFGVLNVVSHPSFYAILVSIRKEKEHTMNTYPASLTTTNPEDIYTTISVSPVVAHELAPLLGVAEDKVNATLNTLPHEFQGLTTPHLLQEGSHAPLSMAISMEGVVDYGSFHLAISQTFLHREDCTQMLREASLSTLCRLIRRNGSHAAMKVACARIEEKKRAQAAVLAL